jgi:hypothetical protein
LRTQASPLAHEEARSSLGPRPSSGGRVGSHSPKRFAKAARPRENDAIRLDSQKVSSHASRRWFIPPRLSFLYRTHRRKPRKKRPERPGFSKSTSCPTEVQQHFSRITGFDYLSHDNA